MKISVVQLNAGADKDANLRRIVELVQAAAAADAPDLVILPEVCACLSGKASTLHENAEPIDGRFATALSALAARLGIYLHSGSFIERRANSYFNTSLLFGRNGALLGRYSKIHRFDIDLPDGTSIRESQIVERGDRVVVTELAGLKLGFAICYDLRFPELFRQLSDAGADLIVLPSAFTFQTGADHWEVLIRARAIETQCYVAAPGQIGGYDGNRYMNFGHSMIVDPWGLVVAQASNQEGHASATIDLPYVRTVRQRLPVRSHRVLALGG